MADVKVFNRDGKFCVWSPYNAKFVAEAKRLGGRWNGEAWTFELAVKSQVREIVKTVYGVEPISDADAIAAIADKPCKVKRVPAGHYMITLPAIPHSTYLLTINALLEGTNFTSKNICGMYNLIAGCNSSIPDEISVATLRDMMLSGRLIPVNYAG